MRDETFEKMTKQVFEKSIEQFDKDTDQDPTEVFSNQDLFNYIDKQINAIGAHNERFTEELVKKVIHYYEAKNNN